MSIITVTVSVDTMRRSTEGNNERKFLSAWNINN